MKQKELGYKRTIWGQYHIVRRCEITKPIREKEVEVEHFECDNFNL